MDQMESQKALPIPTERNPKITQKPPKRLNIETPKKINNKPQYHITDRKLNEPRRKDRE